MNKYQKLRAAAEEEIMCRQASDTSDNWQDLATPEAVIELVDRVVELQQQSENDPRIHEIVDLKVRIAELELAQSLYDEGASMLCGQYDDLAAAMGWTTEIAMAQGVSQLEYARALKDRITELEGMNAASAKYAKKMVDSRDKLRNRVSELERQIAETTPHQDN